MAVRGKLVPIVAVGIGIAMGAVIGLVTPGCQGRECEPTPPPVGYVEYGKNAGEGSLVDQDTWQSTSLGDNWLDFPPYRSYGMFVPQWMTGQRQIVSEVAYVSVDPQPDKIPTCDNFGCTPESNWTVASGNLAEFSYGKDGFMKVTNATCAHFYVRVVFKAYPPAPSPPDAGADGAPDSAPRDAPSE